MLCHFSSVMDKMLRVSKSIAMAHVWCFLVTYFMLSAVEALQCLSNNGAPVDWFVAYKPPASVSKNFYYMDPKYSVWQLSSETLSNQKQAVAFTLNQIYEPQIQNVSWYDNKVFYAMYNDKSPDSTYPSKKNGHSKGVIGFDVKSGFWLVHSVPGFPPQKVDGYSWPNTGNKYGQSFICMSMTTKENLNEIGRQFLYIYPQFYDNNLPQFVSGHYQDMTAALKEKHVTSPPWFRETTLHSLTGVAFVSFAKFGLFNTDLYSVWMAPRFKSNVFVETWQNGGGRNLHSNCTGQYKVYDIERVEFKQSFKVTQDHSKWAVTNDSFSRWSCIGDLNRQESQMKRHGGTVCFQDKNVWKQFRSIVVSYQKCTHNIECKKCKRR